MDSLQKDSNTKQTKIIAIKTQTFTIYQHWFVGDESEFDELMLFLLTRYLRLKHHPFVYI